VTTDELEAAWSQLRRLAEASQSLAEAAKASRIAVRPKLFRVKIAGGVAIIDPMSAKVSHPIAPGPVSVLSNIEYLLGRASIRELATFMATVDQAISWCHDRIEGLKRAEYNARLGPSGKQIAARVAIERIQ
jgi:hypothetical protein